MHDVISVGLPILAILAGILFNRNDIRELRNEVQAEIGGLRSAMYARFDKQLDGINADLRQFYHLTGKLEANVENLKKRS